MSATATGERNLGRPTIVFTDIEGSVDAAKALGASTYTEKLQNVLNERLDAAITRHNGTFQRALGGDSALFTFDDAGDALRCVGEVQLGLKDEPIACADPSGAGWRVRIRIGVHTAESQVVRDRHGQLVGNDVNFAARILPIVKGGQVLFSDVTERAAEGGKNFKCKAWPDRRVRSFDQPETVWELLWDGASRGEPGQ
jgi:class 3 adenylate cyclase